MSDPRTKVISVDYLARVEGEGALYLEVADGKVTDLALKIFEPPRFFEAFLQGRSYREAPDITARICGICPIAYMTSAAAAMEDAFGVELDPAARLLRRLIYCGEWIESHGLHIYMLHAPDFLGYPSAVEMAADYPDVVRRGLRLKKVGNDLMTVLGGREIHPINPRVGGFWKAPSREALAALVPDLEWALEASRMTIDFAARLPFPDFERDYEFVSLRHPDEYPIAEGRIVSTSGLDIGVDEWGDHFEELHVERSNALQAVIRGRGAYHVGPLARYANASDLLTPTAREAAERAGLGAVCRNPFKSIIVRAVEVLYAVEESLRLIEAYRPPGRPHAEVVPKAGVGHGASEAPRGILYHRYELDDAGIIRSATIVPPTSQNQLSIENDLAAYVPGHLDLPDDKLTWRLEQAIRNYDPCISCATHFLKLDIDRG